jgi:predicted dehydrogenase
LGDYRDGGVALIDELLQAGDLLRDIAYSEAERWPPPRVLVVGAGSIGSRHIKNLLSLGARVSVYRYRKERSDELSALGPITVADSIEAGLDDAPNAIVISNRTDQHLEVALTAARRGIDMFIEKPLAPTLTGLDELCREVDERGLVVEVGCMLRFHPTLRRVRELMSQSSLGRVYVVRAWVGQHLADWRPGTDYRGSYSARISQGGGVLLDLIHELDYLLWMLGEVSEVAAFSAHLSDLETDAEDVVVVLLRFASGAIAELQLDCFSPVLRRGCEIVGSEAVLTWDYTANRIELRRREPNTDVEEAGDFERNQMYRDHMGHFLARLVSRSPPAVGLDDGVRALEVALAARASASWGRAVRPDEVRLR